MAISLAILALAVVSTMLLFPSGIKAQQISRFQLLACAKAEEMIEAFNAMHNVNMTLDTEAYNPWDVTDSRVCMTQDLERISSPQQGIMPLPLTIANRIDSDNDEIANILAEGGYVYYSQPMATAGVMENALNTVIASQTQKLIFAVTGYAQNNAMHLFPWKVWPYYMPYPSPPAHGPYLPTEYLQPGAITFSWILKQYCWETTSDIDIGKVFWWDEAGTKYGYGPYAYGGFLNEPGAVRYVQSALWYCLKKGLPAAFYNPATATPLDDFSSGGAVEPWLQVQAMRFLAHAATCMTKYHKLDELGGQPSINPGVSIPAVTLDGFASPAIDLTHDKITYYHESCMRLVTRYAASYPYDFGAPRPTNRGTMLDCPLLEWDLFSPRLSGTLFNTAVPAEQWHPLSANPIAHIGRSYQFPDRDIDPAIWGDSTHFTLTAPFKPAERCRQLVFWAADWQAYEDFETTQSAPVDASKYNLMGPIKGASFTYRMDVHTYDSWNPDLPYFVWCDPGLFNHRNPEKNLTFKSSVSGLNTGSSVSSRLFKNKFHVDTTYDQGSGIDNKRRFSGMFGADRNFNKVLDRGPLPASTRIHAQLVGRFNFYDVRCPHTIR